MAARLPRHVTSSFHVRLMKTVTRFSSVTEFASLHSNVEEINRKEIGKNSWHLLYTISIYGCIKFQTTTYLANTCYK